MKDINQREYAGGLTQRALDRCIEMLDVAELIDFGFRRDLQC